MSKQDIMDIQGHTNGLINSLDVELSKAKAELKKLKEGLGKEK